MTNSRGTVGAPNNNTSRPGSTATGRPTATGTRVGSLNNQDYDQQRKINQQNLEYTKQQDNLTAAYYERMERNIYAPKQRRELAQDERKNDRNAKSQENVAAQQAAASMYGSKQSADASKYGSKQSADAQKFAAAEGTKQAQWQSDAQKFAANVDAAARQFETQTKGRTEFSGLLANLAAAVGNKSADNTAALLSTAGQVSAAASQGKNADADRMADIYKSIMQTYNTGSGQFRYW